MEKLGQCNEMFAKLQEMTNKHVEKYTVLFPEYRNIKPREKGNKISNRMRKQRCKNTRNIRNKAQLEANKKHIKNLSNKQLTKSQIHLLAKGLKFIPTPVTNDNLIRQQLLHDFEQFARRIHKPTPVGRPIILGCNGPTEKVSCFVDKILQPIAQQQKSYLKDTTDFVNFIEKTKLVT